MPSESSKVALSNEDFDVKKDRELSEIKIQAGWVNQPSFLPGGEEQSSPLRWERHCEGVASYNLEPENHIVLNGSPRRNTHGTVRQGNIVNHGENQWRILALEVD